MPTNTTNLGLVLPGLNDDADIDDINSNMVKIDNYVGEVFNGVGKNGVYRGKNFGIIDSTNIDAFVSEHQISNGVFYDLYLGDYFTLKDNTYNKEWMIAAFDLDYMKPSSSNTSFVTDHLITIIPRGAGVVLGRMHSSDTTQYALGLNSEIYTTLEGLFTHFNSVLGSHIRNGRGYVVSAATDGIPTNTRRSNSGCSLMNSNECFSSMTYSSSDLNNIGGKRLLPVFQFIHPSMFVQDDFWMENINDSTRFVCTQQKGSALGRAVASDNTKWIRPKMYIG